MNALPSCTLIYVNIPTVLVTLRIWDCLLWEGNIVLLRVGMAICKLLVSTFQLVIRVIWGLTIALYHYYIIGEWYFECARFSIYVWSAKETDECNWKYVHMHIVVNRIQCIVRLWSLECNVKECCKNDMYVCAIYIYTEKAIHLCNIFIL